MIPTQILVIEDEPLIAQTLRYALDTEGFVSFFASTGNEGLKVLDQNIIHLIIMDVGLPDINGFELCKTIRKTSSTPILFLTARSDEINRVVGLEIGGDDYVTKPFSPREVTARIRAILRRSPTPSTDLRIQQSLDQKSFFRIHDEKFQIYFSDTLLDLTRYEYKLLKLLLNRPGQVFSRDQLMERVWDDPASSLDRTVDAHIKSLRAKLKEVRSDIDPIQTHRGIGYSLKENL